MDNRPNKQERGGDSKQQQVGARAHARSSQDDRSDPDNDPWPELPVRCPEGRGRGRGRGVSNHPRGSWTLGRPTSFRQPTGAERSSNPSSAPDYGAIGQGVKRDPDPESADLLEPVVPALNTSITSTQGWHAHGANLSYAGAVGGRSLRNDPNTRPVMTAHGATAVSPEPEEAGRSSGLSSAQDDARGASNFGSVAPGLRSCESLANPAVEPDLEGAIARLRDDLIHNLLDESPERKSDDSGSLADEEPDSDTELDRLARESKRRLEEVQHGDSNRARLQLDFASHTSAIYGQVQRAMERGQYERVLERLEVLRDIESRDYDFEELLQIAECEVLLQRVGLRQCLRPMMEHVRNRRLPNIDEVLELSMERRTSERGRPLSSLILRLLWIGLHDTSTQPPGEAAAWIANNIAALSEIARPLVVPSSPYRSAVMNGPVRMMRRMIRNLRATENRNPEQVMQVAESTYRLAQVYQAANSYSRALRAGSRAIDILVKKYGRVDLLTRRIYGQLLNLNALSHQFSNQQREAELLFIEARYALSTATDFPSEQQKREEINRANAGLSISHVGLFPESYDLDGDESEDDDESLVLDQDGNVDDDDPIPFPFLSSEDEGVGLSHDEDGNEFVDEGD